MNKLKKLCNHVKEYGLVKTIKWVYKYIALKINHLSVKNIDFIDVENDSDSKEFGYLKELPNIFIVASIPYYDIGAGQRCSQLAKTFNKMGYNVNYLYAYKSSENTKFSIEMPMSSHIFIDDKIIDNIKDKVHENDLFIFESPCKRFSKVLDYAINSKCNIVYESIDNWETSLGNGIYDEDMLYRLLANARVVVGTAKYLVEQLNGYLKKYKIKNKKVLYLPNAVDEELFCGLREMVKPKDLVVGKKTLLYYGSLWGSWFDWDLLNNLAKNNPEYSINLIGDYSRVLDKDECPDNIHFLGLKKQYELPAYLKYVDFSFIPFKTGEISDYVSPLKVFEYISMYTCVISTYLPDISNYPNCYFGNTYKEWESIINKDVKVDREAADNFVNDNTWFNRVDTLIDNVYNNKSILKDNLSIVILNYNNKDIIFKSINSLLKYNELYNYEIIVVDNGSSDGSYELLKSKYKNKIKLYKNTKNGCSSGRNLGVSKSNRKYILFLDSDQWATNKYFLHPYERLLKHDDIGLIGWAAGFFNDSGISYYVVDNFPYRYMPQNMLARSDISYLGSGGMLIKRDLFKKVNGFDELYDPTCYEDTDLSLKVLNEGKKIVYCPYLGIIHLPHQTTKDGTDAHTKILLEKREYFKNKWMDKNPDLLKRCIK